MGDYTTLIIVGLLAYIAWLLERVRNTLRGIHFMMEHEFKQRVDDED